MGRNFEDGKYSKNTQRAYNTFLDDYQRASSKATSCNQNPTTNKELLSEACHMQRVQ